MVGEGEAVEEGDEMLTCRDCNNEFAFTVGEQQFFKEKGFDNKPTRCGARPTTELSSQNVADPEPGWLSPSRTERESPTLGGSGQEPDPPMLGRSRTTQRIPK